ncbi:ABC transporter transmembrane domain-containing protein [Alicyclobacillus fodiniaquatilis]|uniref:ABC transporter transmembrane domain-containing protein n=1 Tax=Alicyclobacillus fodiniaquatilis TaxID=1661150 RepID=A0ABW4JG07_9BACL
MSYQPDETSSSIRSDGQGKAEHDVLARLRLRNFWFWREMGGKLKPPTGRTQMVGVWKLIGYIKYVWWAAIGLLAFIILSSYLGVLPAFVIKNIVNNDIGHHSTSALWGDIWHLLLVYALLAFVDAVSGWFSSWSNSRIIWRLREDVIKRQMDMPLDQLVLRGAGQTTVRSINEVGVPGGDSPVFTGVAGLLSTITSAISNVVQLISAIIAMFALSVQLSLWAFLLLPIPIFLAIWWGRLTYGAAHRQYETLTKLTGFLLRHVTKQRVLLDKLLGRRRNVEESFRDQNRVLTNASIFEQVFSHWYDNTFQIITAATIGILWLIGGHHIFSGALSLGVMLAMVNLVSRLDNPIHSLAELWFSFRSLAAVAERVSHDLEKFDAHVEVDQPTDEFRNQSLSITTVNATIADANGHILASNLHFSLESGEVLTIVDEASAEDARWSWAAALSGWSLLRQGNIKIGRHNIHAAPSSTRRAIVSIISGEFPDIPVTIREFWRKAAPESDEATWKAAWRELIGDKAAFPDVDVQLGSRLSPTTGFQVSLVAASLRQSPVWVVISEPADTAIRWNEFHRPVIRIQPRSRNLPVGTKYLVRRSDEITEQGVVSANEPVLQRDPVEYETARLAVPDADASSPEEAVQGENSGWWRSMELGKTKVQKTGRFFVPFRWLLGYIRRFWLYWLVILVFGVALSSVGTTVSPLFTKHIIDVGIGKHNHAALNVNAILLILFGMAQGVANGLFVTLFVQMGGKRMCGEIRDDFFSRLIRSPFSFFQQHDASDIVTRGINDVNAIYTGTDQLIKVLTWQVIPNIPGMVLLWTIGGAHYGLLTLAVDIPFVVLTLWVARFNARLQQRLFEVVGNMFKELHKISSLQFAFMVRALGVEREEIPSLSRSNRLLYRLGLVQSLRNYWYGTTLSNLESNVLTAAFYAVGGLSVIHGSLTLGTLTAIMSYAALYVGLGGGVSSYVGIYGILANVERVSSYHAEQPERESDQLVEADASLLQSSTPLRVGIQLAHGTHVVQGAPGTLQRIQGQSGFIDDVRDAILRLRETDGIDVRAGDTPVADIPLDSWRKMVTWISSDFPFDDVTLKELLQWSAYSPSAQQDAIRFLQEESRTINLDVPATRWTQNQSLRTLRLLGALAIAQHARVVLVELPLVSEAHQQTLQQLKSTLPDSTFILLETADQIEFSA